MHAVLAFAVVAIDLALAAFGSPRTVHPADGARHDDRPALPSPLSQPGELLRSP